MYDNVSFPTDVRQINESTLEHAFALLQCLQNLIIALLSIDIYEVALFIFYFNNCYC